MTDADDEREEPGPGGMAGIPDLDPPVHERHDDKD